MRIMSIIQFSLVLAIMIAAIWILNKFKSGVEAGTEAVKEVFKAVDPTSNENIIYSAANEVVNTARGESGSVDTLGTWLAGIFDPASRAAAASLKEPSHLNDDEYDPNNPPLYSPF